MTSQQYPNLQLPGRADLSKSSASMNLPRTEEYKTTDNNQAVPHQASLSPMIGDHSTVGGSTSAQQTPSDIIPAPRSAWFPYVRVGNTAPQSTQPPQNLPTLKDRLKSYKQSSTTKMKPEESASKKRSQTEKDTGCINKKPKDAYHPHAMNVVTEPFFKNDHSTMQSDSFPVSRGLPNSRDTEHLQYSHQDKMMPSMYPSTIFCPKMNSTVTEHTHHGNSTGATQQFGVLTNGYSISNVRPSLYSTRSYEAGNSTFTEISIQHSSAFKRFIPQTSQPQRAIDDFEVSKKNKKENSQLVANHTQACSVPLCSTNKTITKSMESSSLTPKKSNPEENSSEVLTSAANVRVNQRMSVPPSHENKEENTKFPSMDQQKQMTVFPVNLEKVKKENESPPNERKFSLKTTCNLLRRTTEQCVLNSNEQQMMSTTEILKPIKIEIESPTEKKPKPLSNIPTTIMKSSNATDTRSQKKDTIQVQHRRVVKVEPLRNEQLTEQKPEAMPRMNPAAETTDDANSKTKANSVEALKLLKNFLKRAQKESKEKSKTLTSGEQTTQQSTTSFNLARVKREVESPPPERKPDPMPSMTTNSKKGEDICQTNTLKDDNPIENSCNANFQGPCSNCTSYKDDKLISKPEKANKVGQSTNLLPTAKVSINPGTTFDEKAKILLLMKIHRKKENENNCKSEKQKLVEQQPETMSSSRATALQNGRRETSRETSPKLSTKNVSMKTEVCCSSKKTNTTLNSSTTTEESSLAEEFRKTSEMLSISEIREHLMQLISEYKMTKEPTVESVTPNNEDSLVKSTDRLIKSTVNLDMVKQEVEPLLFACKTAELNHKNTKEVAKKINVIKSEPIFLFEEEQAAPEVSSIAAVMKDNDYLNNVKHTSQIGTTMIALIYIKKEINAAMIEGKKRSAKRSKTQKEESSDLKNAQAAETYTPINEISSQCFEDPGIGDKQIHEIPLPPSLDVNSPFVPLAKHGNMESTGSTSEIHSSYDLQEVQETATSSNTLNRDLNKAPRAETEEKRVVTEKDHPRLDQLQGVNEKVTLLLREQQEPLPPGKTAIDNKAEQAEARRYLWADFPEKQSESCHGDSNKSKPAPNQAVPNVQPSPGNTSLPRDSVSRPSVTQICHNHSVLPQSANWDYQYQQYPKHDHSVIGRPHPPRPFMNMRQYDYASYPYQYYTPVMTPDVARNHRMMYIRRETERRIVQTREYCDLWDKVERQVERERTMRERYNFYPHYSRR